MTDKKTVAPEFGDIPVFPVENIKNEEWRDGLVVRVPNWLGDAVMAMPALLQLKKIIPENCGLFVVTQPGIKDLFESMEIIDRTIALHKAHSAWNRDDITKVKRTRAGICLLQNNSLRDAIHFRFSGIPKLYGAAKRGRSVLLTRAFPFPKIIRGKLNKIHHIGRYLAMSYALGAPEWKGDLPHFISLKEPEIRTKEVARVLESQKLLVIAPGAAYGPAKKWPAEYFREVCVRWIDTGGEVAVIGTAAEQKSAEAVLKGLPDKKCFDLTGVTDMKDLIDILPHAERCVANDSGIMHLSAVLGGKGVAVFGSTDPSSTSPVSTAWRTLYKNLDCSPCFKRECPEKHYRCLKEITPDDVWNALTK